MPSPPPIDHLGQCPAPHLRQAAWELGIALFGYTWSDYPAFVQKRPLPVIIQLLEWIAYYSAASAAELHAIHSLPALIRAHLNQNCVAQLRRDQRAQLITTVLTIHVTQLSGETTYEYQSHRHKRSDGHPRR